MNWLYLVIAIISEVIGTSALKASEGFSKLHPSLLVILGYGTAFYFLSLTLRTIPVGIAYAIWSGLGVVLITIVSWILFNQRLDPAGWLGIFLITSGVIVLNLFSKTSVH